MSRSCGAKNWLQKSAAMASYPVNLIGLCLMAALMAHPAPAVAYAQATVEAVVKFHIETVPGVELSFLELSTSHVNWGYGVHNERWAPAAVGGAGQDFTANLFAESIATSPPESYAYVRHSLEGSVFAVLSNTTAAAKTVRIESSATVVSDVTATGPLDWARVNYRLKFSGQGSSGNHVEKIFFDRDRTVAAGVGAEGWWDFVNDTVNNPSFQVTLAAGEQYSLSNDGTVLVAEAFSAPVPEPASAWLWGLGLLGITCCRKEFLGRD